MSQVAPAVAQNTWAFMRDPMIVATGFREYDARWRFPEEINLPGLVALGLGIGTQLRRHNKKPVIVVGQDYREYSLSVKQALILGLLQAGIEIKDIGPCVSPMAYFAQFHLDISAVAMVTASHNPNGWTGVKMGFERPLTHGPDEMNELKKIVLSGNGQAHSGGTYEFVDGIKNAYLNDIIGDFRLRRPIKIVCATGNGTASVFAPELLRRIGVEVIERHCDLDYLFPNYNPNPESLEMLEDMAAMVRQTDADLALGFDGDGDRCGVVDDEGEEIFADKVGVILARDLAKYHRNPKFVVDIKSTGLFVSDPELRAHNVTTDYWKTGHSHMKRRVKEIGALAGFEKSGHYFLAEPIGHGYDCALRVAIEICKLLDRNPSKSMSELHKALPRTFASPTMSPYCPDAEKYEVSKRLVAKLLAKKAAKETFAGREIIDVITVNGGRVVLDNGAWGLIRPSSNTPNLVVVCESPDSDAEKREIFAELDALIQQEEHLGDYDQKMA